MGGLCKVPVEGNLGEQRQGHLPHSTCVGLVDVIAHAEIPDAVLAHVLMVNAPEQVV